MYLFEHSACGEILFLFQAMGGDVAEIYDFFKKKIYD